MRSRLFILIAFIGVFAALPSALALEIKHIESIKAGTPLFMAIDRDGLLYVTQREGGVRVMDKKGELIREFEATDKRGADIFGFPSGIAIHKDKVYVADDALSIINTFDLKGDYHGSFGSFGTSPKQFMNPRGIYARGGMFYVADKGNNRIQIFGPDGTYMGSIGDAPDKANSLLSPSDVSLDAEGRILAIDGQNRRLKAFSPSGEYVKTYERFLQPFSIAMCADGFYVADYRYLTITKYSGKGNLMFQMLPTDLKRGRIKSLAGIAVNDEGLVYAADTVSGMIHVFGIDDKCKAGSLRRLPSHASFAKWAGMSEASADKVRHKGDGFIYGLDRRQSAIFKYKDGRVIETVAVPGDPVSFDVDANGFYYALDAAGDKLMRINHAGGIVFSIGGPGDGNGMFNGPADVLVAPDNTIYVADRGNARVQHLDENGKFMGLVGRGGTSALMKSPRAMAMDKDGILYVLDDEKCNVTLYAPDGLPLKEIGRCGAGRGRFLHPEDIAVTEDHVFVLDRQKSAVAVFNKRNEFLMEFGSRGSGTGEFSQPSSISALDDFKLMVADPGNKRIAIFDLTHVPLPPIELSALAASKGVSLKWKLSEDRYVRGYRIYRAMDGGEYGLVFESGIIDAWVDASAVPGKKYSYRISSITRADVEGAMGAAVSVKP